LIRLFPFLVIALVVGAVLHHFFGAGDRGGIARRKIPRQHYRWDEHSARR
jgi:hypothetical protein